MPPEETQSTEETQNTTGTTPEQEATAPRAADALVSKIASESPVTAQKQNTAQATQEGGGEETFIHFVAEKNTGMQQPQTFGQTAQQEAAQEEKRKKAIRTYHTDMAETIRKQKLSMTSIAAKEQDAKETPSSSPEPEKKPKKEKERKREKKKEKKQRGIQTPAPAPKPTPELVREPQPGQSARQTEEERGPFPWRRVTITTLSALFIAGGVGLLVFLYIGYTNRTAPAPAPAGSIILANQSVTLDVSDLRRNTLLGALDTIVENETGTINDVINIQLTDGLEGDTIDAPDLFALLETQADPALLRSVGNQFMLGLHILREPQAFLILKTSFFENAFAGMLRWESQIAQDLPFLVRTIPTYDTASGTFFSTAAVGTFEDVVVSNKDARGRLAEDGSYDIVYAFADTETLIITGNTTTLSTILERFVVSRFEQ